MRVCIHWQPEETCWLKLALFQLLSYLQPHDTYSKKDLSNNLPFLIIVPSTSLLPFLPSSFQPTHPHYDLTPSPLFPSVSESLHFLQHLPSPLSSSLHPPPLVLEVVCYMMKCTYWETLVRIFTSLYLPTFGVSVSLMQAQGPQKGERHTNKERQ